MVTQMDSVLLASQKNLYPVLDEHVGHLWLLSQCVPSNMNSTICSVQINKLNSTTALMSVRCHCMDFQGSYQEWSTATSYCKLKTHGEVTSTHIHSYYIPISTSKPHSSLIDLSLYISLILDHNLVLGHNITRTLFFRVNL